MGKLCARLLIAIYSFISLITASSVYAYEVETHTRITREAIQRSVLADPLALTRIGLYPELESTWLLRPNNGVYQGESYHPLIEASALYQLEYSVRKEDSGTRVLQHFFDPQNDRGQIVRNAATGESVVAGLRSWQWALRFMQNWEDAPSNPLLVVDEQHFTAEHAKDYFEQAVLADDRLLRQRRYGQFLSSLGHVIHHVQDMAQPDHVRNDPHCNAYIICNLVDPLAPEDIFDPSEYEVIIKDEGYERFNQWNYQIPQFDSYKAFWTTPDDAGMADFTNRFAVSKDTNFQGSIQAPSNHPEFPFPDGRSAVLIEEVDSLELMNGVEVSYTHTEVRASYSDEYLGTGASNEHLTATHSLFALDIETAELLGIDVSLIGDAGFSINRNTFISAASQLLPRAEAYSAGLINYMLRGRLGVRLPERGYYALTDFEPETGFTSLRFRLRNETPDVEPHNRTPIPQDARAGEIVAVVSYRPNPCFEDDLSGELHVGEPDLIPSGCSWETWNNATDEVRLQSSPIAVSGISRTWEEYTFDFSASPIPFSARDVEVFFVFRGDLGSEEDAIIVERKNISEPTYFTTLNSSDFFWNGEEWEDGFEYRDNDSVIDDMIAAQYHDMSYDYDLDDPHATGPDRLDAGHFQRQVALVDPESTYPLRLEKVPEFNWPASATYGLTPLLNETREIKLRREFDWHGFTISGPERYLNRWCDDEGCTVSGLSIDRGTSQWSILRQYYVNNFNDPQPTAEDWDELPDIFESSRQPVTVHE